MRDKKESPVLKVRYEKPEAIKLGSPAKGSGDCVGGTGDSETCCTGFSALIGCIAGTGGISSEQPE